jgi:hypothetical protein
MLINRAGILIGPLFYVMFAVVADVAVNEEECLYEKTFSGVYRND